MDKLSRNILNQAKDFMCVPQVGIDPFRDQGQTFAQELKDYINFVHDDPMTDTNDVTVIY